MDTNPADTHVQTLKRIGRNLLNANQLAEALGALAEVLRLAPTDSEAHIWLGDIYLAGDDPATARRLYLRAQTLGAAPREIQTRLAIVQMDGTGRLAGGEPAPTDPAALERLIRRLTGRAAAVNEQDVKHAAQVLRDILDSRNPADAIARQLPELEALLPSLLELNIRDADQSGRPNLAEALRGLQETVRPAAPAAPASISSPGCARLLIWDLDGQSLRWPLEAWRAAGYRVDLTGWLEPQPAGELPLIIARHPHLAPEQLPALQAQVAAGARLILVLDTNVAGLTPSHLDYDRLGLSTPERQAAYATVLRLAHLICVPNPALADLLRPTGCPVRVIPPAWSAADEVWQRPAPPRSQLQIGWLGSSGEAEELAEIRRPLLGTLREFENTRLVIIGDPAAYQLFHTLPDDRRLYLPVLETADELEALRQVDVLIWPLRNTLFNRTRSEAPLLAAGLRRIPWLGSPTTAALGWTAGGLIAAEPDDWRSQLRRLAGEPELRRQLGAGGYALAETREIKRLAPDWQAAVAEVLAAARTAAPAHRPAGLPSRLTGMTAGQSTLIRGTAGA